MGRVRITIQGDGLAAAAAVEAGSPGREDAVLASLAAAGVVEGIDPVAVASVAASLGGTDAVAATVVAHGRPPEHGADGRIEPVFSVGKIAGRVHRDGHIDWHERDLLHPVAAGQVVGRIVEPTSGSPGVDVRGRALPARPGRPHAFRFGSGVRTDGSDIVATRDGVVLQDQRTLDVVALHEHRGDVDLRSGNLRTHGSLSIRGDVADGFTVEAGGDVVVAGSIQHGTVVAGGNVFVTAAVLAASTVRAGGDIACRHATSSRLEADGDVDLRDEATHSDVRAEHIRITSGRGTALGGALRARTSITLVDAGTPNGAATTLAVADVLDATAALVRDTNVDVKATRAARREQRTAGGAAGKATRAATRSQDQVQQQRLQILQRRRALLEHASIVVTGTLHVGVRIDFGADSLEIDARRQRIRFRWDAENRRIVEEPLP